MIKLDNNIIAKKQIFAIIFILLTSGANTLGTGISRDGAISIAIAALLCIPFVLMLFYVVKKRAPINRVSSIPFCLILFAIALVKAVLALGEFIIFIKTVSMSQTSPFLIGIVVVVSILLFARGGILQMSRWSEPVFWVVLVSLLLSMTMTIPNLDIENVFPIMEYGVSPVINQAIKIFLMIFVDVFFIVGMIRTNNNFYTKTACYSVLLSGAMLALVFFRNILLLGFECENIMTYPSYTSASLISLGTFFQRGEVLVSSALVLCDLLKIAIYVMFAKNSLMAAFPKVKDASVVYPICAILFCAGTLLSEQSLNNNLLNSAASIVVLIITVIIFIASLFINKKHPNSKSSNIFHFPNHN